MPVLHEQSEHIMSRLFQEQGGHARIDSARQTDSYLHLILIPKYFTAQI
jgi:hypothetical protein